MKIVDSSVSYSRMNDDQTTTSADSEKVLIGHHDPINVNFSQSVNEDVINDKYKGNLPLKRVHDTNLFNYRNLKTHRVIACITVLLFLLAVLINKLNNIDKPSTMGVQGNSTTREPLDSSSKNATVEDELGSLSEILSSRISLISSNNPKFIVTAEGKKIVPRDIVKGGLTVVDIYSDYIVVSLEEGETRKIPY